MYYKSRKRRNDGDKSGSPPERVQGTNEWKTRAIDAINKSSHNVIEEEENRRMSSSDDDSYGGTSINTIFRRDYQSRNRINKDKVEPSFDTIRHQLQQD